MRPETLLWMEVCVIRASCVSWRSDLRDPGYLTTFPETALTPLNRANRPIIQPRVGVGGCCVRSKHRPPPTLTRDERMHAVCLALMREDIFSTFFEFRRHVHFISIHDLLSGCI